VRALPDVEPFGECGGPRVEHDDDLVVGAGTATPWPLVGGLALDRRRGLARDVVLRPRRGELEEEAITRASLAPPSTGLPTGYASFLDALKARIRAAQVKAALAVNAELVLLYWSLGREIRSRQDKEGWGARVIDRFSADLHAAFPEMKGFSPRNLKYMRAFAEAWPDQEIVQQLAARLPWFHSWVLLDRAKEPAHRDAGSRAASSTWLASVPTSLPNGPLFRLPIAEYHRLRRAVRLGLQRHDERRMILEVELKAVARPYVGTSDAFRDEAAKSIPVA
jgi:hypothetical protein